MTGNILCRLGLHFFKRLPDEEGGYGMGGSAWFNMRQCRCCGLVQNRHRAGSTERSWHHDTGPTSNEYWESLKR